MRSAGMHVNCVRFIGLYAPNSVWNALLGKMRGQDAADGGTAKQNTENGLRIVTKRTYSPCFLGLSSTNRSAGKVKFIYHAEKSEPKTAQILKIGNGSRCGRFRFFIFGAVQKSKQTRRFSDFCSDAPISVFPSGRKKGARRRHFPLFSLKLCKVLKS